MPQDEINLTLVALKEGAKAKTANRGKKSPEVKPPEEDDTFWECMARDAIEAAIDEEEVGSHGVIESQHIIPALISALASRCHRCVEPDKAFLQAMDQFLGEWDLGPDFDRHPS